MDSCNLSALTRNPDSHRRAGRIPASCLSRHTVVGRRAAMDATVHRQRRPVQSGMFPLLCVKDRAGADPKSVDTSEDGAGRDRDLWLEEGDRLIEGEWRWELGTGCWLVLCGRRVDVPLFEVSADGWSRLKLRFAIPDQA